MKETVIRFGYPFTDRVVRQMAIIADGYVMMARLLPGIVRLLHHVTVDTSFGITAQIAGPFAVAESKCPQPENHSQKNREERREQSGKDLGLRVPVPRPKKLLRRWLFVSQPDSIPSNST